MTTIAGLLGLDSERVAREFSALSLEDKIFLTWQANWAMTRHAYQVVPGPLPDGTEWYIWNVLAGRGTGKTRLGAETIGAWAWRYPETRWLVAAPTSADVRDVCFEGESGLMSVIPTELIQSANTRSLHEIILKNGSIIKGIPGSEPRRFRGPQFHGGWCCIAGTMIRTPAGETDIVDLRVGDFVQTRHGTRAVTSAGRSGNPAELVRIKCGATSLTVTVDHPILVRQRWVPAGEIRAGDQLWVATDTLAAATRIASSMSAVWDRSRTGGSSITRTRIAPTTILRTWWRCLAASIRRCTPRAGLLRQLNRWPPRKPSPGTGLLSRPCAVSAGRDLFRSRSSEPGSSVHASAARRGAISGSCQSLGFATSAAPVTWPSRASSGTAASAVTRTPRSARIAVGRATVSSVERLANAPTYNLTIAGEHEYLANGIVVHNCDELAAWDAGGGEAQRSWDILQFGMRLKHPQIKRPRIIVTTTPLPTPLIKAMVKRPDAVLTKASTYDNIDNLAPEIRQQILAYDGTQLGRQEIYAEILDAELGGIFKRSWLRRWPHDQALPMFEVIVMSIDPAYGEMHTEVRHGMRDRDPTACSVWGGFLYREKVGAPWLRHIMLLDCWETHDPLPDLVRRVKKEMTMRYGDDAGQPLIKPIIGPRAADHVGKAIDVIIIEEKASGISLRQYLAEAGVSTFPYNPGLPDKLQRGHLVTDVVKDGKVWVVESATSQGEFRSWAEPLVSQLCSYAGKDSILHDDLYDTTTQALKYLKDSWLKTYRDPDQKLLEDYQQSVRRKNPYGPS